MDASALLIPAPLTYVLDSAPGLSRQGKPPRFRYKNSNGKIVRDAPTLARIGKLVIPPAWSEVWIAPVMNAHIQATGRDARGRKQYIYHPEFRALRDENKFAHILNFVAALPKIRAQVSIDMRKRGLKRERVLAAVVRLLETTLIRVGNEAYARENQSYGLTTLRARHARVDGAAIRFTFTGKSGKEWRLQLKDRRLAKIIRAAQELPGQTLFQYVDDDGSRRTITSADINAYLREASGADVTAKDFRTWAGAVLAAQSLAALEPPLSVAHAKRNVRVAIDAVSKRLGNTPTICRKCYVHPAIIDAHMSLEPGPNFKVRRGSASPYGLTSEEAAVAHFLKKRMQQTESPPASSLRMSAPKGRRRYAAPPALGA